MINGQEFDYLFNKLCQAWSISNKDKKAAIYYERLSHFDLDTFTKVVYNILDTGQKFPTIADIKKLYSHLLPRTEDQKKECNQCDGFGRVVLGLMIYKSRCDHGDLLSNKFKKAPLNEALEIGFQKDSWDNQYGKGSWQSRVDREMAPMSAIEYIKSKNPWEYQLMMNPDQFMKGFVFTGKIIKEKNPVLYSKIRDIILKNLGKDMSIQLYKKYLPNQPFIW